MLKKIGVPAIISYSLEEIRKAEKLVLPGVGAFDNGMKNLNDRGLAAVLREEVVEKGKPILGICLGMQLLTKGSEEGTTEGLGWIDAETVRFRFEEKQGNLKIPHMGWNTLSVAKDSPLFLDMYPDMRFYFVHSYHVVCNDPGDVLTTTHYGHDFTSSVQRGSITGVQFHPEKSHKFGMKLLENWARDKKTGNR
jgi:glutamine amidotransferase